MDNVEYFKRVEELMNEYWFFRCPLEFNKGWLELFEKFLEEISPLVESYKDSEDIYLQFTLSQVKEKFGGLRIYLSFYIPELEEITDRYERLSFKVCEVCGKPGELSYDGWYTTLCNEHKKEREEWKKKSLMK